MSDPGSNQTNFVEPRFQCDGGEHDLFFVLTTASQIQFFNDAARSLVKADAGSREELAVSDFFGAAAAARIHTEMHKALLDGRPHTLTLNFLDEQWACKLVPLRSLSSTPVCFGLCCSKGVAPISQTELSRTLAKELRHTIKNKLQGIVGLLRDYALRHPETAEVLEMAIRQLLTISAVYGIEARLTEDRVYLCTIVDEVQRALKSSHPWLDIRELGSVRQVALPFEQSVPIALVINELLTNAAKHTRVETGACINVSLHIETGRVTLRIVNKPAQLPGSFDPGKHIGIGSGLQLVHSLLPMGQASLRFEAEGDGVAAVLTLCPPVVELV